MDVAGFLLINQVLRQNSKRNRRDVEERIKQLRKQESKPPTFKPSKPFKGPSSKIAEILPSPGRVELDIHSEIARPTMGVELLRFRDTDGYHWAMCSDGHGSTFEISVDPIKFSGPEARKMIDNFHRDLFADEPKKVNKFSNYPSPGKVEKTWKDKVLAAVCLLACFVLIGYVFYKAI